MHGGAKIAIIVERTDLHCHEWRAFGDAPQRCAAIAAKRPISFARQPEDRIDMAILRRAVRERRKIAIVYIDANRVESERIVWPIFIAYMEDVRMAVTWCKMRQGFRSFCTDRIKTLRPLDERYTEPHKSLVERWKASTRVPNP